ncbi:hydrogenase assembly chaperone [Izhakiella australiensis]|uniref:Hydrogenase assembly chaperone n=1 Tax=Izhakiella australiensis TaxID=1926881 RepID=A0A1S8YLY2_9GAMM|nr:HypC/HybG/HupF family hydrogenase formation chaperone [Izhakiella australiensis]OON40099.1 hydrogenase assembly chaperone [Izhakiella australiensis]
MCIGVPGRICEIISETSARAEVCGVTRDVDLTLVGCLDRHGGSRIGQWVLIHVGFAMSVIDQQQALDTLAALQSMHEMEPDVAALLYGEERPDALR